MEQATLIDVRPHAGIDDDNQRFTLDDCDAWLRRCANVSAWDLDVAACAESHRAPRYYDVLADGLSRPWADRVFCNPPWDNIEPWIRAAWIATQTTAIECIGFVLPGGRSHRPWWRELIEPYREGQPPAWPVFCNMVGFAGIGRPTVRTFNAPVRFAYGAPGNPRGIGVAEPNFTTVGVVFRRVT